MIEQLWPLIQSSQQVQLLNENHSRIACPSLAEEALVVSASYLEHPRCLVVVKDNAYQAQLLYHRLTPYLKHKCALFSVEESLRVLSIASSKEPSALRIETLHECLKDSCKVIVTHAGALAWPLMNPEKFKERTFRLKVGDTMSLSELKQQCLKSGYTQVHRVDQPLCFAMRGGILDIFSINSLYPLRIEFFDDEIDSIRYFDISTQRTIQTLNETEIIAASEVLFDEDELNIIRTKCKEELSKRKDKLMPHEYDILEDAIFMDLDYMSHQIPEARLVSYFSYLDEGWSILDYLNQPTVLISHPIRCQEHLSHMKDETISYIQEMVQENKMLPKYSVFHEVNDLLKRVSVIENDGLLSESEKEFRTVSLPNQPLPLTIKTLWKQAQENAVILCLKEAEIRLVTEECLRQSIPYQIAETSDLTCPGLYLSPFEMEEGFELIHKHILVYTSTECFNVKKRQGRFASKFAQAEALSTYEELEQGDYVVHQMHGIGQYMGMITREIGGMHRDFLRVVFKGNDELLVPLEQFQLIRKFVSCEGVVPKLNKLGSKEWQNTREKLKQNVNNIAERLIELYSSRDDNIGYAYQADTPDQAEFENEFEYELTEDQKTAIKEIKADLESSKPMDRLLCGDVGFGKTEVAATAAFKVVIEGKQTAYLCPTTILSLQHYKTFKERFKNYPVRVEMLNRFVPPLKQKQILQDTLDGKVDILIGTHRLLSKDVKFKDLGFLIIDEEQRFGVEHKEKIKEYKQNIDVLSLSATPIPRTLQMSLIGIRSLSQLNTPPTMRMPVQTYVVEKNWGLIQDVIERELSRGGQVFYLFNNIDHIYSVARNIQNRLPHARISVAHGKMSREEIEEVMMNFNDGQSDVLICTTIIETGIDIPNANTILIEDADHFGLSQLYQIKGRVGRSDRVAYAYLLVRQFKQLSEIAQKRLQTIKDFAQLGSGYKIAMRDLTIRGAGDLLGPNQSGFINTVGIDYYIEMLNEAISEKKGIKKEEKAPRIKPKVTVDSYIPQAFAPVENEKISLYKQIDAVESAKELEDFADEVKDNYGHLPKSVALLFEKKRLELLINDPMLESFKEIRTGHEIIFSKEFSQTLDGIKLFETYTTISKDIKVLYRNERIITQVPKGNDALKMSIEIIESAKKCTK